MSNAGQIALDVVGTAVGAVAGYYTGNPVLGAEIGFTIGSVAGQFAFPTKNVPNVQDAHVMGASEGTPIPIVIGAYRIGGCVIWSDNFVQHSHSGKGAGAGATSYSYTVSFALLLCKGPIVGIRRIWADKVLIYDRSEGITSQTDAANKNLESQMAVYLGDETQVADPTMQAVLGPNNVPAHRGTAYLVFDGLDVTAYGARIPQIEVETIQFGELPAPVTDQYATETLYPWAPSRDPRLCDQYLFQYQYNGSGWQSTPELALANATTPVTDCDTSQCVGWSINDTSLPANGLDQVCPNTWTPPASVLKNQGVVNLHFFRSGSMYGNPCLADAPAWNLGLNPAAPPACAPADGGGLGQARYIFDGYTLEGLGVDVIISNPPPAPGTAFLTLEALNSAILQTGIAFDPGGTPDNPIYWDEGIDNFYQQNGPEYSDGYSQTYSWLSNQGAAPPGYPPGSSFIQILCRFHVDVPWVYHIQCRRVPTPPPNPCKPYCENPYPLLPGGEYCVIGSDVVANVGYGKVTETGNYKWLSYTKYANDGAATITSHALGPCLPAGDPNDTEAFWTAAANAANAAGAGLEATSYLNPTNTAYNGTGSGSSFFPEILEDGYNTYPVNVAYGFERNFEIPTIRSFPVPLATALATLCEAVGLQATDIDVSQVTSSLAGFAVSRVTDARSAILPLMTYGFLDAAEVNGKLTFVQRGGAAVASLTEDDLVFGGGKDSGGGSSRAAITRAQDMDLPRFVRVQYTNIENDDLAGQISAPRLVDTSVQAQDIQLAIAMTPTQARQIGDVWLRAAWIGRETLPVSVSSDWINIINSADPIDLSLNGVNRRYIVKTVDYSFPGSLQLQLVRDEQNGWTSIESAPLTGAVAGGGSQSLAVQGPTMMLVLDVPALRSTDNNAGYYAAVYPTLTPWSGATIYRSNDGGANFSDVITVTQIGTAGVVNNTASAWPETVWDKTNTLNVKLAIGTLSSSTINGLMNLANVAAYGVDGRWEIIQFLNATPNSDGTYTLSGLLRGCLGTDQYSGEHVVGDSFVLLTGNIVRLTDGLSYLGTPEVLRAVTSGSMLADAANIDQTPREICLKPLAPVHFAGGRDTAGDVLLKWFRCDRFANDLADNSDVPMSETTESYDLEIYADSTYATVKRTFAALTSPSATYTAAQQVSDFGSAQTHVYAIVYQNSSQIGRGYPASAVI